MRHSGYATIVDPDRPLQEYDSVQCCHCGGVIFIKPGTKSTTYLVVDPVTQVWREEPGAGCYRCGMRPVCLSCYDKGDCNPLERQLDQMEGRTRPRMIGVS